MRNLVLYVEDEEDYQLLVQRILSKAGFDIQCVASASEARAALSRVHPQLLILDVNLPDTNGYGLCQELRKSMATVHMPVIFLTVRRRPEEWLQGFSSGCDDYVPKPINPIELVERVTARMTTKQAAADNACPEYLLIQAAVSGNRSAFEVLVQKYRGRLRDSLRASGKTPADADDLASEAIALAFERLKQFRGESSFYTWLYRIALNESYRPKWRSYVSLENLTQGDETRWPARKRFDSDVDDKMCRSEHSVWVKKAVSHVPKPYRQMLKWYFARGVSYQAMARRLGIPAGTVMSRLFRAKQLLRQAFDRLS